MIWIRYFVNGVEYANRERSHVPREGEIVKLNDGVCYQVKAVVWIENDKKERVQIDLTEEL